MREIESLVAYWEEYPPLHLMKRAQLQIKGKPRRKKVRKAENNDAFFAMFRGGVMRG